MFLLYALGSSFLGMCVVDRYALVHMQHSIQHGQWSYVYSVPNNKRLRIFGLKRYFVVYS